MIRTNKGFTLAELITSTGVASILVLLIALAVNLLSSTFLQKREKMTAEENAARAEVLFKMVFSQAVRIRNTFTPGEIASGTTIPSIGVIADGILFDQIADTPAAWTPLAVFLREASPTLQAPVYGNPARTAIWYRRPESTGTAGVLFFDMGNVAGAMSPSYADQYIDRVSYLSITKKQHPVLDVVTDVDVVIRIRYHTAANGRTNWCPQLDITASVAGCTTAANWNDVERRFSITLRNNLIRSATDASKASSAVTGEERVLGNLFFFQPVLPQVL